MVLAAEIVSKRDITLVARGQVVTASLLIRLQNFAAGIGVVEPIRIQAQPETAR